MGRGIIMTLIQEFYLIKWDWWVKVFYVVDSIPIDYILQELIELGLDDEESFISLFENEENKGYTYSNLSRRKSIIVIGETTCPGEFQHTFDHEKFHLAIHIAKEDGIDPYSEDLAYLVGDIGMQMFPIAKKFLCEHCREEL